MVGSIGKVITSLFGKKSDKDVKDLSPLVNKILHEQEKLKTYSPDELRLNSDKFRSEIQDYIKPEEGQILKIKIEADKQGVPVKEKEDLYKKIDEINKYRAELLDSTLNDLKAFAKYFKTLSEDGVVCVHGSAARIAESKNLFDETLTVGE